MQPHRRARLLTAARLGLAHWFFGNLYEEVVRMPARLAAGPVLGGPFAPGSPVRYHLPAAPVTLASTIACVVTGWHRRADRPALAAAGLLTGAGAALTGHLVRTVNLPLLDADSRPDPAESRRLVAHWHRVNRVRLVVVAAAAVALRAGTRADVEHGTALRQARRDRRVHGFAG